MSEAVTDHLLIDITGLDVAKQVDESALARALSLALASSAESSCNSFQASI
jgi:hypothetical protein